MSNLRQRLRGLAATIAILLLVGGTPVLLVAIRATPWHQDLGDLGDLLTSPDDGTLVMVMIAVVAWAAWAVMALSVLFAATAQVRGISAPKLPGLAIPQGVAGRLVAMAALLFVAVPAVTAAFPAPPAHSIAAPPVDAPQKSAPAVALAQTPIQAAPAAPVVDALMADEDTIDYTVKRGDSLWKIADRLLGDGARYVEIVDLNADVLGGHPDFITAGTVLRVPHTVEPHAGDQPSETYVVEPGDTLSEIALDELGDPMRYPEIYEASRDTVQNDGTHLEDPDVIRPGWKLTIPGTAPREPIEPVEAVPDPPSHRSEGATHPAAPTPGHTREPTAEPYDGAEPTQVAGVDDAANPTDDVTPGWLLPGLTGAGALLAGALLLALRRHRSTQLRFRRPGHIIAPPPPELRAVEKTTQLAGAVMAPRLEALDAALRWLATVMSTLPAVTSVELTPDTLILHLAQDSALPAPWEGNEKTWSLALDAAIPTDLDQFAPYPLLVTVGQSVDQHLWLLNLEHLGVVSVTGDPENAEAIGRYVAAELALNPWSDLVDVDILGLGAELATIAPVRLHHHSDGDLTFLDRLARHLTSGPRLPGHDPEQFHAVVSANGVGGRTPVRQIVKIIRAHPGRPGAAVIAVNSTPEPGDVILEVTPDSRLRVSSLNLDVTAAGLTAEEAAVCAAIVEVTRDAENAPMPVDDTAEEGWRRRTDVAGALRTALVEPRPDGPAGEGSLLPLPAMQYADAAPTTAQDIEALAPVAAPETRTSAEAADPTLDQDIALWLAPECPLPKLVLLGPVRARAHGDVSGIAKRKPFYTELLAYLALHPAGTTSSEIADAMSITTKRAYVDLKMLRSWLGTNPRTGVDHLPSAKQSRAAIERGTPSYQVDDVLVDLDLFRRLRMRAQSRGAAGLKDLQTALRLVTGEPFTQLRPVGWTWLLEGERLDHVMGCAVVDVAHILTTHALSVGDLDLARFSAETAYRAAPYDETSRLDLVEVAAVTGHADLAERQLIDGVFNRSDDDLGPVDLPPRTATVVRQRGWDRRPSRR
ncbi:LysM peptidoglycan-binding domain-containing protein [Nocardioides sp.]|uniref:Putative LysM domain protein n=1 Tax=metagenome TaxID=256318 RepID=A0A2P2BX65_9ZZZZ